ncbi:hypothetical protein Bca52824_030178 [Brassica carinata]|uniref:Methyltransferase type 11 domain-containing protein n=1 Tax=Brassica carinata TaxID=52824 RepID=A0A8X7S8P6_BRACI|nr:hypothetical protein Bca52824_030178 [Brassica carinata]
MGNACFRFKSQDNAHGSKKESKRNREAVKVEDHRFPFHDNVFELVHGSNWLDVEGKPEKLEFLMFDLDRVLRPGGLFWLDNFYCAKTRESLIKKQKDVLVLAIITFEFDHTFKHWRKSFVKFFQCNSVVILSVTVIFCHYIHNAKPKMVL